MSRCLYDNITNTWYNYFDDKNKSLLSSIWKEGYDDPTYLTFKVEFGDWGASVLHRDVLDLGVTTFKTMYLDYDDLPMGLLNCPAEGSGKDDSIWLTTASSNAKTFNETPNYSAFTYLRSRNEDVRAEYIMHFVNGLFDVQTKYPYIFKKISGLEGLEAVDPTKGRRINDVEITLDCYEGLDLKIKTLMELYRKAAWDDVYQRWMLPENMREFKMIIYLFERRTFQLNNFKIDKELNLNVPVKVFECSPCEIMLGSIWGSDFDQIYESGEVGSQIKIKVKNVKTYYKNGLLNTNTRSFYNDMNSTDIDAKIEPLLIYDLVDRLDRYKPVIPDSEYNDGTGKISNNTLNGVRSHFMKKSVFLGTGEYNANNIESYGTLYHRTTWGSDGKIDGDLYCHNTNYSSIIKLMGLYKSNGAGETPTVGNFGTMVGSDINLISDGENSDGYSFSLSGILNDPRSNKISATEYVNGVSSPLEAGLLYEYRAPFYYYYVNRPIGYGRLAFSSPIGNIIRLVGDLISPRTVPYTNLFMLPLPEPFYITPKNRRDAAEKMDHLYGLSGKLIDYSTDWWTAGHTYHLNEFMLNDPTPAPQQDLLSPNDPRSHEDEMMVTIIDDGDGRNPGKYVDYANGSLHETYHDNNQELLKLNDAKEEINDVLLNPNDPKQIEDNTLLTPNPISKKGKDTLVTPLSTVRVVKDRLQELILDEIKKHPEKLLEPNKIIEHSLENLLKLGTKERDLDDITLFKPNDPSNKENEILGGELNGPGNAEPSVMAELNEPKEITLQEFELLQAPTERHLEELSVLQSKTRNVNDTLQSFVAEIRTLPDMQDFTMEDAREIPEEKLQSLKQLVKDTVPSYQVNKDKLINLIKTVNVKEFNEQLLSYDKPLKAEELQQLESLRANNALMSMVNVKTNDKDAIRKQELLTYVKEYSSNADAIKLGYADEIKQKRQNLIKLSVESIEKLPAVEMYTLNENEKDNNDVLISLNDVRQLEKNIELIALEEKNIDLLSALSLIKLDQAITEESNNTLAMIGLSAKVEHQQLNLLSMKKDDEKVHKIDENKKKKRLGDSAKLNGPKQKKNNKIAY